MTLLSKASLVATPTAYGDGVLNSVKPTDGAGDFDFARASSATRVNEEGYIEKERENLLLQSNTLNTTWFTNGPTLVGNQSGYDGSSDAWQITKSTAVAYRYIAQYISSSGVQTASFYAKAGSLSGIGILVGGGDNPYVSYDLSTGTILNQRASVIDSTMTDVGGGWYRCTMTFNTTISGLNIYPDWDQTNTGNLYLQDIQLEQGLVARDYIETTTSSVAVGITNNIPRINYENGIGNFLLEPQRSNLIGQSEYYGSYWNINDVTIISNDAISPEGIQNATKITESATLARHRLGAGIVTIPTAGIYISSVFMKKGTARYGFVHFSGTASYTIVVDLEEGIITDTATNGTIAYQNIEDYGNGWYRCSVGGDSNTATTSYLAQFGIAGSAVPSSYNNYIPQYTGSTSNYLYAYGNQLEAGYITTYIPSYGSAVTRAAETCNNAGNSDLFNDSEGVLYAEVAAFDDSSIWRGIVISDGTPANRIAFYATGRSNANEIRFDIISSGSFQVLNYIILDDVTNFNKIAIKYKINDVSIWVNGTKIATDLSATMPIGLSKLMFNNGSISSPIEFYYGKTKMVSTFTEALSDSELECLTSWSSFNRMATAQNYTIE